MTQLGKDTGRPVWFLLTDRPTDPERWRRLIDGVRAARADRLRMSPRRSPAARSACMLGVDTALNPSHPRELPGAAQAAAGRAPGAAARPRGARRDPGRRAVEPLLERAAAVPPAHRHALGPHVPAGRPAGLRAAAEQQHRRHGGAAPPSPAEVATTIWPAGRRPDPVLPRHQLHAWRPRGHPRPC